MARTVKIIFVIIAYVFCFIFGFLLGLDLSGTQPKRNFIFGAVLQPNEHLSTTYKQYLIESFPDGYNSTHLWSMRLADENYFRLARLLPCRNVSYARGPTPANIDSCDHSSTNEFSLPNRIKAQKWLYDHQHPTNCSNKRFAIIHNFAYSGFGSTVHQIVWAFGMALADNRIAIYQAPGNWVSQIFDHIEIKCIRQFKSIS
jgi:hypothetical protein